MTLFSSAPGTQRLCEQKFEVSFGIGTMIYRFGQVFNLACFNTAERLKNGSGETKIKHIGIKQL